MLYVYICVCMYVYVYRSHSATKEEDDSLFLGRIRTREPQGFGKLPEEHKAAAPCGVVFYERAPRVTRMLNNE